MNKQELITVKLASHETWNDFVRLFEPTQGCDGCWCYNHHLAPEADDVRFDAAKHKMQQLFKLGRVSGSIAYLDDEPVGWCALDPRSEIPGHDCLTRVEGLGENGAWTIHCFYVKPTARRRGIALALLRDTLVLLKEQGARIVEAFPTPEGKDPFFGAYAGPYQIYKALGFEYRAPIDEDYCQMVYLFDNHV